IAVDIRPGPLNRLDGGDGHTRDEIRVFAVSLFGAAPARLAAEIEIWPKHLMTAARSGLLGCRCENARHQLGVPTRSQRDWLRKAGAALGHVAVQYLVVKDYGNSETRVFE